jgi:hypothetical protein
VSRKGAPESEADVRSVSEVRSLSDPGEAEVGFGLRSTFVLGPDKTAADVIEMMEGGRRCRALDEAEYRARLREIYKRQREAGNTRAMAAH